MKAMRAHVITETPSCCFVQNVMFSGCQTILVLNEQNDQEQASWASDPQGHMRQVKIGTRFADHRAKTSLLSQS